MRCIADHDDRVALDRSAKPLDGHGDEVVTLLGVIGEGAILEVAVEVERLQLEPRGAAQVAGRDSQPHVGPRGQLVQHFDDAGQQLTSEERELRFTAQAGALLLRGAAGQLEGFLGLHDTAKTLEEMATAIAKEPLDTMALLDEAILYVGRLSHWLDLYFPWRKLNDVTEAAAEGRRSA